MESVVLVIHLIIAASIVIVVLLQRSEGGGLGIGGSGGGLGNFASQRTTADVLTRLTTMLGAGFMVTSLALAILASQNSKQASGSILDVKTPTAPVSAPVDATDAKNIADDVAAPAAAATEETKDKADETPKTDEKPAAPVSE